LEERKRVRRSAPSRVQEKKFGNVEGTAKGGRAQRTEDHTFNETTGFTKTGKPKHETWYLRNEAEEGGASPD